MQYQGSCRKLHISYSCQLPWDHIEQEQKEHQISKPQKFNFWKDSWSIEVFEVGQLVTFGFASLTDGGCIG